MKKILFISLNDHVAWGGSEELWCKVALHLKEKMDVHVLVKKWIPTPFPIENLENNQLKIFYKNAGISKKKKTLPIRLIKRFFFKTNKNKTLHELDIIPKINEFKLVVISVGNHLDSNLFYYTNFLKKIELPYVIIVQLATDLRNINDQAVLKFKEAYQNAKKIFFLSQENAFKTELQLGVKLNNKDFINNPFHFQQSYTSIILPENTYTMGCVAAFTSFHKGQDLLISVLGQEKWKNRNIFLNLYGKGDNQEQLESLIEIYELKDRIKLNGFVTDKEKIWGENMLCIMPSRMEGQSLAMLEAMSHGRMVISTKVGDAERLIVNNKTGFLIDAPTFEFIDITLENAWAKRNDWLKMGMLAREHLFSVIQKDPVIEFAEKLEKIV